MGIGINGNHNRNFSTHNIREAERRFGNQDTDAQRAADAERSRPELSASASHREEANLVGLGNDNRRDTGPTDLGGGVTGQAYAAGPSLNVDGSAEASAGPNGIDVSLDLNIDATAVEAGASAEKTFQVGLPGGEQLDVTVDLAATGKVGADGNVSLDLNIGPDGVTANASVEGFAGAQAGLEGGIRVEHEGREVLDASAGLTATAGVAGAAEANLGLGADGVSFGAKASASVGVGAGFEVNGTFNPVNGGRAVAEIASGVVRDGASEVVGGVVDGAQAAGSGIARGAEAVGGGIANGASNAVDKARDVLPFV